MSHGRAMRPLTYPSVGAIVNFRTGSPNPWSLARGLLTLLLLPLALLPEEARRWQEQLAEADHDRPSERIEQVGLIIERHPPVASCTLGRVLKMFVDLEPHLRAAQPRMLDHDFRNVAGIREQPEVERRQRREVKIVAVQSVHVACRCASSRRCARRARC